MFYLCRATKKSIICLKSKHIFALKTDTIQALCIQMLLKWPEQGTVQPMVMETLFCECFDLRSRSIITVWLSWRSHMNSFFSQRHCQTLQTGHLHPECTSLCSGTAMTQQHAAFHRLCVTSNIRWRESWLKSWMCINGKSIHTSNALLLLLFC